MNDSQITAVAIIFVAAIGPIMYNNSRITDLRTNIGKRIDDLRNSVNQHIDDKFGLIMERLQGMEDKLTSQLANHDYRITKLEQRGDR